MELADGKRITVSRGGETIHVRGLFQTKQGPMLRAGLMRRMRSLGSVRRFTMDEAAGLPPLERQVRRNESLETRRKRVQYQSKQRGWKENTLIMSTFADMHGNSFTVDDLEVFDMLLATPDPEVYEILTEKIPIPSDLTNSSVVKRLIAHTKDYHNLVNTSSSSQ